jgi:hypothetical protein
VEGVSSVRKSYIIHPPHFTTSTCTERHRTVGAGDERCKQSRGVSATTMVNSPDSVRDDGLLLEIKEKPFKTVLYSNDDDDDDDCRTDATTVRASNVKMSNSHISRNNGVDEGELFAGSAVRCNAATMLFVHATHFSHVILLFPF